MLNEGSGMGWKEKYCTYIVVGGVVVLGAGLVVEKVDRGLLVRKDTLDQKDCTQQITDTDRTNSFCVIASFRAMSCQDPSIISYCLLQIRF